MAQPNFDALSLRELCTHLLEHRDDSEVFQAYMDRLHTESPETEDTQWYSIKDMSSDQFTELLKE